jgi:hypothetical protein
MKSFKYEKEEEREGVNAQSRFLRGIKNEREEEWERVNEESR